MWQRDVSGGEKAGFWARALTSATGGWSAWVNVACAKGLRWSGGRLPGDVSGWERMLSS